jgi:hypothetical protein
VRCKYGMHEPAVPRTHGWSDSPFYPSSQECEFCVIRGTGEKGPGVLERLGQVLSRAIEAIAAEELLIDGNATPFRRFYAPLIVTTASLHLCRFDAAGISLSDGTLPTDSRFEEVSFVRFRKNLTSSFTEPMPTSSFEGITNRERTVLVLNAGALVATLERLRPSGR